MASGKTSKTNFVLVVEMHSSSVKVSVVNMTHGNPIQIQSEVICSSEMNFSLSQKSNSYLVSLKKMIELTTREFELYRQINSNNETKKNISKISSVQYVLSSPWILSQAHTVSVKFRKNEKITENFVNNILDKKDIKPSFHIKGDMQTIERKVLDVSLNGYPITDWKGKLASSVDITCIVSAVNTNLITDLQELCLNIVGTKSISFHSSLVLQYIASSSLSDPSFSVLIINIHGEITDVFGFSKQNGIFFGSFPIGYNTLVSRFSSATHQGKLASESVLSMHSSLNLDITHNHGSVKIIDKMLSQWKYECLEFVKVAFPQLHKPHIFISSRKFVSLFSRNARSIRSGAKCEELPHYVINEALSSLL